MPLKRIAQSENSIARMQAFVFYLLRSGFKSVWDDGLADWKAVFVMSITTTFALISLAAVISILFHRRLLLPDAKSMFVILWGGAFAGLFTFNCLTLLPENKWSRFEADFQHTSKLMRIWGGVAVLASVILIFVAAAWTGSIASKLPPFGN
jgi:hypothetical protein